MFEERYIQWLMQHAFTLDRRKPPVRYLSLNLQSLLQGLHLCRQKTKFSNVITDLYAPILWKYLNVKIFFALSIQKSQDFCNQSCSNNILEQ